VRPGANQTPAEVSRESNAICVNWSRISLYKYRQPAIVLNSPNSQYTQPAFTIPISDLYLNPKLPRIDHLYSLRCPHHLIAPRHRNHQLIKTVQVHQNLKETLLSKTRKPTFGPFYFNAWTNQKSVSYSPLVSVNWANIPRSITRSLPKRWGIKMWKWHAFATTRSLKSWGWSEQASNPISLIYQLKLSKFQSRGLLRIAPRGSRGGERLKQRKVKDKKPDKKRWLKRLEITRL